MRVSDNVVLKVRPELRELNAAELAYVCGGDGVPSTVPIFDSRDGAVVGMDTNMIVDFNGHDETLSTVLDNAECIADIASVAGTDGAIGFFDGATLTLDCLNAANDDWTAIEPYLEDFLNTVESDANAIANDVNSWMWCPSSMDPDSWDSSNFYDPYCS
jgi:hypothetical protein